MIEDIFHFRLDYEVRLYLISLSFLPILILLLYETSYPPLYLYLFISSLEKKKKKKYVYSIYRHIHRETDMGYSEVSYNKHIPIIKILNNIADNLTSDSILKSLLTY